MLTREIARIVKIKFSSEHKDTLIRYRSPCCCMLREECPGLDVVTVDADVVGPTGWLSTHTGGRMG